MMQLMSAKTRHIRRGEVENRFDYRVDYLLLEPEKPEHTPWLFSRNRLNLMAFHDQDHGGKRDQGKGAAWVRDVLAKAGLASLYKCSIQLLAQPRMWGTSFTPVSFWLIADESGLRAVIAEVNNTFGERHSYLCRHDDWRVIQPGDQMQAEKVFHVSPFQEVRGSYTFNFALGPDQIAIHIRYENGNARFLASLSGKLRPLSNRAILAAAFARPLGSVRVLALIHFQALRLWLMRAPVLRKPAPPIRDVTE